MIQTIKLLNEFSKPIASSGYLYSNTTAGKESTNTETNSAGVFFVVSPVETKPSNSKDIDDFIGELLVQQPALEKDLREGRQWVADALYSQQPMSLKVMRLRAGLSQLELAEKIGMKQPNICEFEAGKRKPSVETLKKLSVALGVTADEILKSIEKPE